MVAMSLVLSPNNSSTHTAEPRRWKTNSPAPTTLLMSPVPTTKASAASTTATPSSKTRASPSPSYCCYHGAPIGTYRRRRSEGGLGGVDADADEPCCSNYGTTTKRRTSMDMVPTQPKRFISPVQLQQKGFMLLPKEQDGDTISAAVSHTVRTINSVLELSALFSPQQEQQGARARILLPTECVEVGTPLVVCTNDADDIPSFSFLGDSSTNFLLNETSIVLNSDTSTTFSNNNNKKERHQQYAACSASFMGIKMRDLPPMLPNRTVTPQMQPNSKAFANKVAANAAVASLPLPPPSPTTLTTIAQETMTTKKPSSKSSSSVSKSKSIPDSFFSPDTTTAKQSHTVESSEGLQQSPNLDESVTTTNDNSADTFHGEEYEIPEAVTTTKKQKPQLVLSKSWINEGKTTKTKPNKKNNSSNDNKDKYGYEQAEPDVAANRAKYGYEEAEPDVASNNKYGYEEAVPDVATNNAKYGYEDAEPDVATSNNKNNKYGYEEAVPDVATNKAKYGYEEAVPDAAIGHTGGGNHRRQRGCSRVSSMSHMPSKTRDRKTGIYSSSRRRSSSMDLGFLPSAMKGGRALPSAMKGGRANRREQEQQQQRGAGSATTGVKKISKRKSRSISFDNNIEVHLVSPISKDCKDMIWFQANEKKVIKKNLLKAVQVAKSGGMDSTYHGKRNNKKKGNAVWYNDDLNNSESSFCLRGIEGYMDDVATWRSQTMDNLYDMVLDTQSIQRASKYFDDVQLAGFSQQVSEESKRLAIERALHDAMIVGTYNNNHSTDYHQQQNENCGRRYSSVRRQSHRRATMS